MFSPTRLASNAYRGTPANTQFHVRWELRLSTRHVPYVRPVVKLTTRSGARL